MDNIVSRLARSVEEEESRLLSGYATKNKEAFRAVEEALDLSRSPFALDRDRIFYSGAFRRYTGKTQVIYFVSLLDEQLTSRSLHTLSVAQIARAIGRLLRLNNDLIEAIALGHDLGHPPFGHDGEMFLSEVSEKYGLGLFHHNIQSLRVVDRIAKKGKGLNLTFQTRDGILSHNGEVHNRELRPDRNKSDKDLQNYIQKMENGEQIDMMPSTLEGCVVRITDTIAYIGQDIDDAVRIGLIKREDLPVEAVKLLGSNTGQIIDTLVNDVIIHSQGRDYVCFGKEVSEALLTLKNFNYESIYKSPKLKINHNRIRKGFEILFDYFLNDLKKNNRESEIYIHFLISKSQDYLMSASDELKVRDYLAGMTDRYFTLILKKIIVPEMADIKIFNE